MPSTYCGSSRRKFFATAAASAIAMAFAPATTRATSRKDKSTTEQAPRAEDGISIVRAGSQAASTGPADYFTGAVTVTSRFQQSGEARIGGGIVSFSAGARTAWHTHPLGQTLFVISGRGLVRQDGGDLQTIRPGDIVWIPPGIRHWHGAAPDSAMSHLAFSEALDGTSVAWLEKVTDDEYRQ